MIISGKQVQSVLKTYSEQTRIAKGKNTEWKQQQDEVILSPSAQEFGQVLQGIMDVPDVREDRVRDLSKRIENGTYHVDAKDIADKMLGRSLVDSLR